MRISIDLDEKQTKKFFELFPGDSHSVIAESACTGQPNVADSSNSLSPVATRVWSVFSRLSENKFPVIYSQIMRHGHFKADELASGLAELESKGLVRVDVYPAANKPRTRYVAPCLHTPDVESERKFSSSNYKKSCSLRHETSGRVIRFDCIRSAFAFLNIPSKHAVYSRAILQVASFNGWHFVFNGESEE